MLAEILKGNPASLLTEQEMREVNAYQNYPRRKLSPLEEAVRDLRDVLTDPEGKGSEDVPDILGRVNKATNMFTVRELARDAVNDSTALQRLVEMYPYVQYSHVIAGNLNVFQSMRLARVSGVRIQEAVLWLHNFHTLVMQIPDFGDKNWFIHTPNTPHHVLRNAVKDQPECTGLVLTELLQAKFDALFRNAGEYSHPLSLIQEYNLHKVNGLFERFGLHHPVSVDHEDRFYRTTVMIDSLHRIGMRTMPVLTALITDYPLMGSDQIRVYRFVL